MNNMTSITKARSVLEILKREEGMQRAAAERSASEEDREVHAELARLFYGRRKWLQDRS